MSTITYQLCKNTKCSFSEGIKLLLICRQAQPHVQAHLHRNLLTFVFIHRVLGEQTDKKSVQDTSLEYR